MWRHTFATQTQTGRLAMRAISAEPYANNPRTPKAHTSLRGTPTLTTAFVRNANPIQICSQIWRWVDSYRVAAKQKGHSNECPFCFAGDPYGNRTHDSALRGLRLSRLTNGPFAFCLCIISYVFSFCKSFFYFFIIFLLYAQRTNFRLVAYC